MEYVWKDHLCLPDRWCKHQQKTCKLHLHFLWGFPCFLSNSLTVKHTHWQHLTNAYSKQRVSGFRGCLSLTFTFSCFFLNVLSICWTTVQHHQLWLSDRTKEKTKLANSVVTLNSTDLFWSIDFCVLPRLCASLLHNLWTGRVSPDPTV